ncbi:MAG: HD domain-containing protein [Geobacter sp.]|nr:HD domain-containing protein [Geobacter sp.]
MNALDLLHKYFPEPASFKIVCEHSRRVAEKALFIAKPLGFSKDRLCFIEEAALLHDIGICRINAPDIGCIGADPYIRHGIHGREILENEGLPLHALVCERHIGVGLTAEDIRLQSLPLPKRDMSPVTIEERIVCCADLFYSKKPGAIHHEKSVEQVRQGLARFGIHKVELFDSWLSGFGCGVL